MNKKNTEHTIESDVFANIQQYYKENEKIISGVVTGILLLIAAYIAFFHWYLPRQEQEAQEQMFKAVFYFENDNYSTALDGDGNYPGLLEIIRKYPFTKAANLAHYYAGLSYLHTNKFEEAIKHLKKFGGNDKIFQSIAYGAIGDAYFELNKPEEGLKYYRKACNVSPNELTTPIYLLRTALALHQLGKTDEAIRNLEKLKSEYPHTTEGRDADKYLARMGK